MNVKVAKRKQWHANYWGGGTTYISTQVLSQGSFTGFSPMYCLLLNPMSLTDSRISLKKWTKLAPATSLSIFCGRPVFCIYTQLDKSLPE